MVKKIHPNAYNKAEGLRSPVVVCTSPPKALLKILRRSSADTASYVHLQNPNATEIQTGEVLPDRVIFKYCPFIRSIK